MVRNLLVRGMLAGLVAGLAAFVFASVFGEPGVDGGIAFEEQAAARAGDGAEVEMVSRGVQSTIGLATAVVVYGVAIGGIFALVYAVLYGRVGRMSPRATSAVIAVVALLVVYVVPFVKYPANPPGSNDGSTISQRTGLYLVMILFSVVLAGAAVALGRRLAPRLGTWNAAIGASAGYVVAVGIVEYLMPVIDETPADFPAAVLYDFRIASLGGQILLWTVLGLVFGALVDRSSRRSHPSRRTEQMPGAA
jgi:Probable cobalt transporter subunit (CbtA)